MSLRALTAFAAVSVIAFVPAIASADPDPTAAPAPAPAPAPPAPTPPATPSVIPKEAPRPPPPPPGFDAKAPLGAEDLQRKKEGGYFTGLPLANFDPNTGIGGGARGYYYYNGYRSNPFFAYTPYLHRIFAQAFFSTGGLQFHWLDYDAPALMGTAYRLRSQFIFLRNTASHFYGEDGDGLRRLTFTGAGRTYGDFSDYQHDLRALRADGTALTRYNEYDLIRPLALVSVERTFLKGLIRPLVGLGFSYAHVDDYTGERVRADGPDGEVDAVQSTTLLKEQCDQGLLDGCDGGWDNIVRFGVSFDTRDFEPDPNSGVFADLALDVGTIAAGSQYDYVRFLASARYYLSLLPSITDLVLAGRATFQVSSKHAPFFSLDTLPFTEDPRTGLGGHRTLRGYQQDRFIGHVLTLLNLELRWTFFRFDLWKQKFALMVVPFLDIGRPYGSLGDLSLKEWKRGQGGAVRISWNLATIVSIDYGISEEDSGLYINFNHQF